MPKPNKAMQDQARQGLELRREWNRGGTAVGVARARDIVNGADLSMDTVRRMRSYFARHGANYSKDYGKKEPDGGPNAFTIAWKLWGGSPGRTWANNLVEKEDERMNTRGDADELSVDHKLHDDHDNEQKRHIKRITETDDEVIVVFGKSDEYGESEPDEAQDEPNVAGWNKDKDKREARPAQQLEVREAQDGTVTVEGYAAVFNEETIIGGQWREQIAPGAFTNAIGRDDVVFLINHAGLPLARSRSGTLQLSEDDRGLKIRASLDTSDPDVRSIVPKMKRGDLDKMSFAFVPTRQAWDDEEKMPRRTIQEVELYDVSIVTTPAYEATEIGLRSLEQYRAQKRKSQAARRLRMKARQSKL